MGAEIALGDLNHDFSHVFDDITHVVYAAGSAETEGIHEERAIDCDAVMRTADYAKRRRVQQIVVVSALSALLSGTHRLRASCAKPMRMSSNAACRS